MAVEMARLGRLGSTAARFNDLTGRQKKSAQHRRRNLRLQLRPEEM
jgi:hypothetical protein